MVFRKNVRFNAQPLEKSFAIFRVNGVTFAPYNLFHSSYATIICGAILTNWEKNQNHPGHMRAYRKKGREIRRSSAGQAKQMQYPLSMPCLDVSPVFRTPAQEMRVRAIEE